jgi:hypothetical protein
MYLLALYGPVEHHSAVGLAERDEEASERESHLKALLIHQLVEHAVQLHNPRGEVEKLLNIILLELFSETEFTSPNRQI